MANIEFDSCYIKFNPTLYGILIPTDSRETFEFEYWDPDDKWVVQDVYNHMGETLEQMFHVFESSNENQQYQLDVQEKISESFPLKLEMMKSNSLKAIIDNLRREGFVKGGGYVKFFQVRKVLWLSSSFIPVVFSELFRSTKENWSYPNIRN